MEDKHLVPDDVKAIPADATGNGFMIDSMWVSSVIGSDGEIYVRKNGVITIAPLTDA